jgi:hypothetical protein
MEDLELRNQPTFSLDHIAHDIQVILDLPQLSEIGSNTLDPKIIASLGRLIIDGFVEMDPTSKSAVPTDLGQELLELLSFDQ